MDLIKRAPVFRGPDHLFCQKLYPIPKSKELPSVSEAVRNAKSSEKPENSKPRPSDAYDARALAGSP